MLKLETAKALKEAKWSKKTERVWLSTIPIINTEAHISFEFSLISFRMLQTNDMQRLIDKETYPCPSLEELLAELPASIDKPEYEGYWHWFVLSKSSDAEYPDSYTAKYITINDTPDYNLLASHLDPAEACALLWLKLRKEGLL